MKHFLEYLLEEENIDVNKNVSLKQAVNELKNALTKKDKNGISIAEQYAKCITVAQAFDVNGIGTLSEKIFVTLLSARGYKTAHTGAANDPNDVTDLTIDTKAGKLNISLKTSKYGEKVGLGRSIEIQNTKTIIAATKEINNALQSTTFTMSKTPSLAELTNRIGKSDIVTSIEQRINKIIDNVCGKSKPELFMQVFKNLDNTTNAIKSIDIGLYQFNKKKLEKFLMETCYVYTTDNAWGLKLNIDNNKAITVVAANNSNGFYLNFDSKFLYRMLKDDTAISNVLTVVDSIHVDLLSSISQTQKEAFNKAFSKLKNQSNGQISELDSTYIINLISIFDNIIKL